MTKARDLADGVINTAELADGSITTAKIADGDITDAKLATGISASKLSGALPAISGAALTGISAGLPGPRAEVFTSSGTFTVPAGVTACKVTVVGGGGGGGKAFGTCSACAGAGGGGTAIKWITGLTAGDTVSVTVGAGGAGHTGTTSQARGDDGGTSSFGAYCSATGGKGSYYATTSFSARLDTQNFGGTGTGGDLNIDGGPGSWGLIITDSINTAGSIVSRDWAIGGSGGAPMGLSGRFGAYDSTYAQPYYPDYTHISRSYGPFGGYAGGGAEGLDGYSSFGYVAENATGYGCGGAGGATGGGIDVGGGNGYQGIVIVEY